MATDRTEPVMQWTGITLTAEHHLPSILTPDFLAAAKIVPAHWRAVESRMSPDFSSVDYHNGVSWRIDQDTLTIEDERRWLASATWDVQALASRYLNEVRIIPYRNLTINFRTAFSRQEPFAWITKRFLNPALTEEKPYELWLVPQVLFEIPEGPIISLTMNQGTISSDSNTEEDAVVVSTALFHDGPLDWSEMEAALDRMPVDRETALALVYDLLEEEL